MLIVPTLLRPSPIHGIGVFAVDPIRRGEAVWRFDERFYALLDGATIRSLPPVLAELCRVYAWPHMKKPDLWCLDTDNGRFMNHSLAPNTDFRDPDIGRAIADIAAGEEITCNYFEFDPDYRFGPPA